MIDMNLDMPQSTCYRHRDDYKYMSHPIDPEFITVQEGSRFKYIFRISFKCGDMAYVPMSFVVDSGLVTDFLLSSEAMHVLQSNNILSTENKIELCDDDNCVYEASVRAVNTKYSQRQQNNYIGIKFIQKYGFIVKGESFRFERNFQFF